jgi:hypothetical protein
VPQGKITSSILVPSMRFAAHREGKELCVVHSLWRGAVVRRDEALAPTFTITAIVTSAPGYQGLHASSNKQPNNKRLGTIGQRPCTFKNT